MKRLTSKIRIVRDGGLFHNSRLDTRTLARQINTLTEKVNELVDEVNELKGKNDETSQS